MTIRRLLKSDSKDLVLFLNHDKFDCCGLRDFWTVDELSKWFSVAEDICLGYFGNDGLIGFCLTHFCHQINKVYLENIYVNTEYRGRGIAPQLINETIRLYSELFPETEKRYVALIEENNAAVSRALSKCGFKTGDKMLWVQRNK